MALPWVELGRSLRSTLFYMYQDRRYQRHQAESMKSFTITPAPAGRGAAAGLSFDW